MAKEIEKKKTSKKKVEVKEAKVNKEKKNKKTPVVLQEENNYLKPLGGALLILIILAGFWFAYEYKKNNLDEKVKITADEKKFKDEYESINGVVRSNNIPNKTINIMDNNNIEYKTLEEVADILDNGSGVIYFGFASCPWCRNAVPVLLNAMDSSDLDKIYYVNVRADDDKAKDIRDEYTLDEKNKPKMTRNADDAYYRVLRSLASYLDDYTLTTAKGKKVSVGEKRLMAPTFVAVRDGVVVGFHSGTVDGHNKDENGVLRDLTKDEETTLLNTFTTLISAYLNNSCGEEAVGC